MKTKTKTKARTRPPEFGTLTVKRSDGRLIDVPFQNPVDPDRLIVTLQELRDLDFGALPA